MSDTSTATLVDALECSAPGIAVKQLKVRKIYRSFSLGFLRVRSPLGSGKANLKAAALTGTTVATN
jgi:hypothetical protein